ncbi:MAG: AmmeMemoRadiSam system protein B [Dehalococcoidales bacterium]
MIRQPAVAGQFYPGTAEELRAAIDGLVDKEVVKEEVIGLVSPHAGYIYSGPVAGATISRIKFRDTFIVIGPNHTGMGKPFSIMTEGAWQTPLGEVAIDSELARQIRDDSSHLEEDTAAHQNEHSVEVQIPFLQYFKPDVKIVPIVLASASADVLKEIGREIAGAVSRLKRPVVILASSDMTHYEPQAAAAEKDRQAIGAILDMDEDKLLERVAGLGISMCGYVPVVAMMAAARELGAGTAELVKYQTSGDISGDYGRVVGYAGIILKGTSPLAELARKAVEGYIRYGKNYKPAELTPEMAEKAGVFVCLKRSGQLRGCIGTFEPCRDNVAGETVENAISSATRDPRFPPVMPEELDDLTYSVDILGQPEPVAGIDQLDVKRYGVIVEAGPRRGLLLPDLEGVDSPQQQIAICRQKAGIGPDEPVKLYRFEVRRYE